MSAIYRTANFLFLIIFWNWSPVKNMIKSIWFRCFTLGNAECILFSQDQDSSAADLCETSTTPPEWPLLTLTQTELTLSTPKPAQVLCFLSQQLAQRPIHLPHRNWCPSSALPCLIIWSVPRFGPLSFYSPVLTAAITWLLAPPFPPRESWNCLLLAILFPVLTPLNPFLHRGTSIVCEIQIGLCWKPLIRLPLFSVKIKSQNPLHSL